MTAIVIDASVAVSWCFEDEASPQGDLILEQVRRHGARVPSLWHLEVANVLRQAERRGRITEAETTVRLELLATLPIIVDSATVLRAWNQTLALARAHVLTPYDAAYVELAARLGLPVASKDHDLIRAATQLGVQVLTI
jgi:predicted nucleic acid-binding protein